MSAQHPFVGSVPPHSERLKDVPNAGSGDPAYSASGGTDVGPVPSPGETVPHTTFVGVTAEETAANARANRGERLLGSV